MLITIIIIMFVSCYSNTEVCEHSLKKVSLTRRGKSHLPSRWQGQLARDIDRLVPGVAHRAAAGTGSGSDLQWGRRGVGADVLRREPGRLRPWVGAGLAWVRPGVRLLEERLGKDFFPPGTRLRVHNGVKKSFQICVKVLCNTDNLLSGKRLQMIVTHFLRRKNTWQFVEW